jgi:uncharacterized protein (DUF58 family)
MLELLKENPWLVVPGLALLIPIFGVIFGTITSYLSTVRRAELEASLKQDMLQRGMSAEEIKTVIEATSCKKGKSCRSELSAHR